MKPIMSMRKALEDPDIFGRVFDGKSWDAWRVWLIALVGEKLTKGERKIFEQLTGRPQEPGERVDEAWMVKGRRAGGTRAMGILAAFLAALCDHSAALAPGERAVLLIISATTWQASRLFNFLSGVFNGVPALKALVVNETSETISLSNGVDVEVRPASFRSIRGATAVAVLADEVAFWRSEETSRNPDSEILNAARPALATTGGLLAVVSSPYAQQGELWNVFKRSYGPEADPLILVGRAPSRTLNPTLKKRLIEKAYERDAAVAAAEYGTEFRSDLSGFVDLAAIEGAVSRGVTVRPPIDGVLYFCFLDPASGSGRDSMTAAICHQEPYGGRIVLDCLLERRPPFNPAQTAAEFAETMKRYRITRATADRWGVGFVDAVFQQCGITITTCEKVKTDLYLSFLPILNSGQVDLLDHEKMISQFCRLERRTSRSGKDSVDHPKDAHDDLCNAAAGAITCVGSGKTEMRISDGAVASWHRWCIANRKRPSLGVEVNRGRYSLRSPNDLANSGIDWTYYNNLVLTGKIPYEIY
jgi:hypothetical protein